MCCFGDAFETVQHLFFECALAKFIWRVIQVTFGLSIPLNNKHVFGDWVQRIKEKDKRLLFVGMYVIFWSIWLSQNAIIFNKTQILSYIHNMLDKNLGGIIKRSQRILQIACQLIETLTMEIFAMFLRNFFYRPLS
jgi:hypothetical protein